MMGNKVTVTSYWNDPSNNEDLIMTPIGPDDCCCYIVWGWVGPLWLSMWCCSKDLQDQYPCTETKHQRRTNTFARGRTHEIYYNLTAMPFDSIRNSKGGDYYRSHEIEIKNGTMTITRLGYMQATFTLVKKVPMEDGPPTQQDMDWRSAASRDEDAQNWPSETKESTVGAVRLSGFRVGPDGIPLR